MPRTARGCVAGYCYYILNRGNARSEVFHKPGDYAAFLQAIAEASVRVPMPLLAYCLLSNHFHLGVRPIADYPRRDPAARGLAGIRQRSHDRSRRRGHTPVNPPQPALRQRILDAIHRRTLGATFSPEIARRPRSSRSRNCPKPLIYWQQYDCPRGVPPDRGYPPTAPENRKPALTPQRPPQRPPLRAPGR
jgi:REP element-mobilizing transposase RayT